ncbi:MAG TPA: hypothetical protein PLX23_12045, partial [Candidatus Hydrogenedens sp.]|nr:hypothetical protein [Candidatus Hydrogenedens sp.]
NTYGFYFSSFDLELESSDEDFFIGQQEGLQDFDPSFCAGQTSFAAQQPGLSFCNGHAEAGFSFVWGSAKLAIVIKRASTTKVATTILLVFKILLLILILLI